MTESFTSALADDFIQFLRFKRGTGVRYTRSAYSLMEFDRFLANHPGKTLGDGCLAWLASKPGRKPASVSMDATVLREFHKFLRRRGDKVVEPRWPRLLTRSQGFLPHILSAEDIRVILGHTTKLERPAFRSDLYRSLILVLYCTGLRFGEALRLRVGDVDVKEDVIFVREFKGRARWVPFRRSLGRELELYLEARRGVGPMDADDRFYLGAKRQDLPVSTAWNTLRNLYRQAGLKPDSGRKGPRPYDLRHTFAVHCLTRWYRQGVDLHSRLPWLSAYMGHENLLGTEKYLTATPELLAMASSRFRRRFQMQEAAL